jgi:hypothetical protein
MASPNWLTKIDRANQSLLGDQCGSVGGGKNGPSERAVISEIDWRRNRGRFWKWVQRVILGGIDSEGGEGRGE